MASPLTAEIIRFRPARPMQGRGAPPHPDSARIAVLPRRYIRHLDADEIARLLDGTDYGEPEVVRRQREFAAIPSPFAERMVEFFRRSAWGIGLVCYVLALLVGMYFAFQLGRGVL